jgi:hypothetical protein
MCKVRLVAVDFRSNGNKFVSKKNKKVAQNSPSPYGCRALGGEKIHHRTKKSSTTTHVVVGQDVRCTDVPTSARVSENFVSVFILPLVCGPKFVERPDLTNL